MRKRYVSIFIVLNIVFTIILVYPPIECNFSSEAISNSHATNQFTFSDENSAPIMEYYPRKFLSFGGGLLYGPSELPVVVIAYDSDEIDSVVMYCKYKEDILWNQSVLDQVNENEDVYKGTLIFKINSSSTVDYDPVTIQVFYIANDTLNNTLQSPVMEFTMDYAIVTVDGVAPLYETPDLWYLVNTTGHSVTWRTQGTATTVHPYTLYTLYKDEYLLEQDHWEGELTLDVDGLSLGNHLYQLSVALGAWPTYDNVTVHVVEELPSGVNTGVAEPITGVTGLIGTTSLGLIIGVVFIGCIVIILLVKKTISQRS